jgi:hypothetical protein
MTQSQSAVRIDSLNIDAEIQKYESELKNLIHLKETALKKEAGFNAYMDAKNFNSQLPTVNFEPVGLRETNEIQGWAVRMNFSF